MTLFRKILLGLFVVAVMTASLLVKASEPNRAEADHRAKAASYEHKVKEQQALIDEHEQMKRWQTNDAITPPPIIRKQNEHCDAIIRDATKLRDDLADFAKWHRMRAAELEGQ